MQKPYQISRLDILNEQDAARYIFDSTWAFETGTEITPNLLHAMVHSGSYLSGAYIDNKIVGAAFAFPAPNNGLHFHSYMTAVFGEYQDKVYMEW
jgi:predicted GNAT superfamily acetyltransferase